MILDQFLLVLLNFAVHILKVLGIYKYETLGVENFRMFLLYEMFLFASSDLSCLKVY